MRFTNSLTINRPVREVFDFIANFENMPKWNYYVLEVRKTSAGAVGLGTTFHQRRRSDKKDYLITEFELNRVVTVQTTPPIPGFLVALHLAPRLSMRFTFTEDGKRTLLTDEWAIEGGPVGLLASLGSTRVKVAVAENLSMLKQLMETGRVQLQDGREIRL